MAEENKDTILTEEEQLAEENASLEAGIQNILEDREIVKEVKDSFLDYAMSVIVARAIPDVRDGLKPVHRRIIYGMYDSGYTAEKPHVKCAKVVGDVMGKFHPHGDSSIYEALARFAQPFSMRYTLVDGHGNFGNIDGDKPAAYRYTESKMNKLATEMIKDIAYDTVDFIPNYDGSLEEPSVLPTKFPNLLVNGTSGIAVGMATNMPTHNLGEVLDGAIALAKNPLITVAELREFIKGPDFPTGGIVYGAKGLEEAYETGRGSFKIRSKAEIIEKDNKTIIHVTEIPYEVRKGDMVTQIAELARDKKIEGIQSIADYSSGGVVNIVITVKKDFDANVVLNQLYKQSKLEVSFGVINLCIVDGVPMVLNLKELLENYLEFQIQIETRKTEFLLKKDSARRHIIEALLKVHDCIHEVVDILEKSDEPEKELAEKFSFSEEQVKAVLDMTLRRLKGIETTKLIDEDNQLLENIKKYNYILESREHKIEYIIEDLEALRKKFGDERRTEIDLNLGSIDDEDLIPNEDVMVIFTETGYIKRISIDEYKAQRRGGKGKTGMKVNADDVIKQCVCTKSHNYMLFFTNLGRVYKMKIYKLPTGSLTSKGLPVDHLFEIPEGEEFTAMMAVPNFDNGFLLFITKNGICKRTALQEFTNIRTNGIKALSLKENDELSSVLVTNGDQEIIIGASNGKAIRFDENDVRDMGRNASGVKGIELSENESVIGAAVCESENEQILVVSDKGYGKRTTVSEYRKQSRGGKGVKTINITEKNGALCKLVAVSGDEDLFVITDRGISLRTHVDQISESGRATQGVKIINVPEKQRVITMAILPKENDEEPQNTENGAENTIEEVKEVPVDLNVEENNEDDSSKELF